MLVKCVVLGVDFGVRLVIIGESLSWPFEVSFIMVSVVRVRRPVEIKSKRLIRE